MKDHKYLQQNQNGFTLLELISIMVIMGVIGSVAVKKVDLITYNASSKALSLAVKDLNVRESLVWSNLKFPRMDIKLTPIFFLF